jgi:import receptor subunit TOM70
LNIYIFTPHRPIGSGGFSFWVKAKSKTPMNKQDQSVIEKERGNKLFLSSKYVDAIKAYTAAIDLHKDAVYYLNRASCYLRLQDFHKCVAECDDALKLNPRYLKALKKRIEANEARTNLDELYNDYYVLRYLDKSSESSTSRKIDELVQTLAGQRIQSFTVCILH